MFQLSNARGEVVGINNYDLTAFTPTGLGIEFNNTYIIKITRPNKYTRMKLLLKTKKILEYGDKIEVI